MSYCNLYFQCKFKRLGYLSLDQNERSNYQVCLVVLNLNSDPVKARELKSVYIDVEVEFFKLVIHKCYINRYNLFNQVCTFERRSGVTEHAGWDHSREHLRCCPRWCSSKTGYFWSNWHPHYANKAQLNAVVKKKPSPNDDLEFNMNYDPITANQIKDVAAAKDRAVQVCPPVLVSRANDVFRTKTTSAQNNWRKLNLSWKPLGPRLQWSLFATPIHAFL